MFFCLAMVKSIESGAKEVTKHIGTEGAGSFVRWLGTNFAQGNQDLLQDVRGNQQFYHKLEDLSFS